MKQSSLLEVLETVLVVTVITALIWLYAEGETINTETKSVTVRLVAPAAGQAVSVQGQESTEAGEVEFKVEATIQASRGNWQQIEERIRNEIIVSAPGNATTQALPINLREALNQSALADVNAFVKEVDPATVSVSIQQLQDVSMAIRIEPGDLELSDKADETPIADPMHVTVTMPADVAAWVSDQKLELIARLNKLDPDTLGEDTTQNASVDLDLPAELQDRPFVSLAQKSVRVKFLVRKVTDTIVLPSVQVRLRLSDEITGLYQIKIDPDTQRYLSATLRGPSNTIQSIRDDESQSLIQASILIKLADLTSEDNHTASLEWVLPEGVEVVATDPDLSTITYTATPLTDQP